MSRHWINLWHQSLLKASQIAKEAKKESADKACGLSSKIILCKEIILNPGPTEFAAGLLLLGATRTKTFVGPYPNLDRFKQIRKLPSLGKPMRKEEKMEENKKLTLQKYANVISQCFQYFERQ